MVLTGLDNYKTKPWRGNKQLQLKEGHEVNERNWSSVLNITLAAFMSVYIGTPSAGGLEHPLWHLLGVSVCHHPNMPCKNH